MKTYYVYILATDVTRLFFAFSGFHEYASPQVCRSCPHKCVVPVPTSVSFLAKTRNPGVAIMKTYMTRKPGSRIESGTGIAWNDNSMRRITAKSVRVTSVIKSALYTLSFLSPQVCHSWRRSGIQESPS